MLKKLFKEGLYLIEERDITERCELLNENIQEFRKKRILLLLALFPFIAMLTYKNKKLFFITVLIYKIPYIKLCQRNKVQVEQLKYEFPLWFRQVQGLLQTNTVYNALSISRSFAPPLIKRELEVMLSQLDINPLDRSIYEEFMRQYHLYEIKKSMLSLYRMNFMNEDEIIEVIDINRISQYEALSKARTKKMCQRITALRFLSFLPMLSVSFLFIYLMRFVFQAMLQGGV